MTAGIDVEGSLRADIARLREERDRVTECAERLRAERDEALESAARDALLRYANKVTRLIKERDGARAEAETWHAALSAATPPGPLRPRPLPWTDDEGDA